MKIIRWLLFPFSLLYGAILKLRNLAYDKGWLKSTAFALPILCVGNLSLGGTGKSPMIEYLVRLLKEDYHVAILSRGYKRETKGFLRLTGNETAKQAGDEPLQFKSKFNEVIVAVDEQRVRGVQNLLSENPKPEVILLDDAFQHRKISPSFSIVLTKYTALYTKDVVLPTGNLREPRSGVKRADVVVVTKCPLDLSKKDMRRIKDKLTGVAHERIFFAGIAYHTHVVSPSEEVTVKEYMSSSFTLVTGIADPSALIAYLRQYRTDFEVLSFPDHHHFSAQELNMLSTCDKILTTEKDFTRLRGNLLGEVKLHYLPIRTVFLEEEKRFNELIADHIKEKRRI